MPFYYYCFIPNNSIFIPWHIPPHCAPPTVADPRGCINKLILLSTVLSLLKVDSIPLKKKKKKKKKKASLFLLTR